MTRRVLRRERSRQSFRQRSRTTTVELSQMSGVSGTTLRTLGSQADGKIFECI